MLDSAGINLSAVYAALEKSKDNYFVDSWANAARVGEEAGAKGGGHGCGEGGLSEAAVRYKRSAEEELQSRNPMVYVKGQKRAKFSGAEGFSKRRVQLLKQRRKGTREPADGGGADGKLALALAEAQTPKEAAVLCAELKKSVRNPSKK